MDFYQERYITNFPTLITHRHWHQRRFTPEEANPPPNAELPQTNATQAVDWAGYWKGSESLQVVPAWQGQRQYLRSAYHRGKCVCGEGNERRRITDCSEPVGPRDTARLPTYCTWKGGHTTRPVSGTGRHRLEGAARVGRGGEGQTHRKAPARNSPLLPVSRPGDAPHPHSHTPRSPLRRGGRASWLTGHPALLICPCRSKV